MGFGPASAFCRCTQTCTKVIWPTRDYCAKTDLVCQGSMWRLAAAVLHSTLKFMLNQGACVEAYDYYTTLHALFDGSLHIGRVDCIRCTASALLYVSYLPFSQAVEIFMSGCCGPPVRHGGSSRHCRGSGLSVETVCYCRLWLCRASESGQG